MTKDELIARLEAATAREKSWNVFGYFFGFAFVANWVIHDLPDIRTASSAILAFLSWAAADILAALKARHD